MEIVRPSSEEEVVLRFLEAEIDKPALQAWMLHLGVDDAPIRSGDISSDQENEARARLLGYRGYRNFGPTPGAHGILFRGMPSEVVWDQVRMTIDELLAIRYMNYPDWVNGSGGTRSALVAAERLREGETIGDRGVDSFRPRTGLSAALTSLVALSDGSGCVLMEGHNRLTTLALHPEARPETVHVYLGRHAEMSRWGWWGTI